ncbi:MAG: ABC transporter substrate-binding protein [Actinobacteria bacterium]|nr:ABC transporter substrate-binding protein [Actinomycetota bacterium]
MPRLLRRSFATLLVIGLVATACGNAKSSTSSTTSAKGAAVPTDGGAANRNVHKPINGVPGVTDDTISYTIVGTKSNNPLGICILDCYAAGVKAYFAWRNSQGGIYGRKLTVGDVVDDQLGQNQQDALAIVSGNKAFGTMQASLLPQGWGDLDKAGVPTYGWGVDAGAAANRMSVFPSTVLQCIDCTRRTLPYAAMKMGAKKAGVLGYSTSQTSKVCADSDADSFKLYAKNTGVQLAFLKDDLPYGLPNGLGPEVTAMKKAGVDFIATCFDLNAMKTLAQELKRQGMDHVVLFHSDSYDQAAVAATDGLFDGGLVQVQFRPLEAEAGKSTLNEFKTWIAKENAQPTELAMTGWINASVAYEGLLAAGPQFDRAKVIAATNAMTHDSAGGLVAPINWTTAHKTYTNATRAGVQDSECSTVVKVVDGKFEMFGSAAKPWFCWNNNSTKWSLPVATDFD